MAKQSAGLLLYRNRNEQLEVLLVHPGGPLWAKKDLGAWSIPKGEFDQEEPLLAARREFHEETGFQAPRGEYIPLKPVRQKSGKIVYAWAVEEEVDAEHIHSNNFEMEWPPRSGKAQSFPEIDRAAWFLVEEARQKINPAQAGLIQELLEILKFHTTSSVTGA
jgi:predicted NUDIX family NTP pyrophosphohydrolase